MAPVVHTGFPNMWKTLWALITRPPDLAVAVWLDENITKVSVELFMPLSLQLFCKQAGVGANPVLLLVLLLWSTVSAAISAIRMPCRSACMHESALKSEHLCL